MPQVRSGSVDIVFSGQNIEHLTKADMVGFMLEANRVLPVGGLLALDSPNRIVTEALGWCHPEHTIELTVTEAEHLLVAAGFKAERKVGLWNCRKQSDGSWIGLDSGIGDFAAMLDRAAGSDEIDDCFCWWITARKVSEPKAVEVEKLVEDLFKQLWTARVNRQPIRSQGKFRTRPFPLFAGAYRIYNTKNAQMSAYRIDGSLLGSGTNIAGELTEAQFGVEVEIDSESATIRVESSST
jgi:hypothetical protein